MNWRDERDHTLVDWARDHNQFSDDEGIKSLTPQAIERAEKLAKILRDVGSPIFTMIPDAHGGIAFEYKKGDKSYVFNIWEDGDMCATVFEGTKLIETFNGPM